MRCTPDDYAITDGDPKIKEELRIRQRHGRVTPRHVKEAFYLSYDGVAPRFPSFPHWFHAVEVPRGFWAELPPVLT